MTERTTEELFAELDALMAQQNPKSADERQYLHDMTLAIVKISLCVQRQEAAIEAHRQASAENLAAIMLRIEDLEARLS